MKSRSMCACRVATAMFIALACCAGALTSNDRIASGNRTIEGLVRDIACPLQNKEATATVFNLKCALECARKGSPLIILAKDGVIYVLISNSMPDKDQRQRLMPFVGKYVRASGKTYERAGTHAIAIEKIIEMKEVHLNTDAH